MVKKQKVKHRIGIYFNAILFIVAFPNSILAQAKADSIQHHFSDSIFIDKIEIAKNWITWDEIIKREFLFNKGEWVSYGKIDSSMNQVWNMGNFADVNYSIEHGEKGNVIYINAQDALVLYPVVTVDYSSEDDYKYRLGIGDENFLGSNTQLKIVWEKQPTGVGWDFNFSIPRQLLYKNMTLAFGFNTGVETNRFLEREITDVDGKKTAAYNTLMLAPYDKREFSIAIGNPWQNDYKYLFSPDLQLSYIDHKINHDILTDEDLIYGVTVPVDTFQFLQMELSDGFGFIKKKRHRKDGYLVNISYALDLGMNGTCSYHTLNLESEYHKIINNYLQLTTWGRTGYTTASNQYQFIKGSTDVLGLRTGEIYGQVFYSAYTGAHFTWVNSKWLSLENAYFLNWGNGASDYSELFNSGTKWSVGTYFNIKSPMVAFVEFRFSFMYAGPGTEWFKFNM
jgi:outer membrane protein assembly factor BamA